MNDEKVMTAAKNVLEREIENLKEKVEKNQEFTYIHGLLDACKWMLNLINNQEELINRLDKIKENG